MEMSALIDNDKKTINISLQGFATAEQKQQIAEAFQRILSSIVPQEYFLIYDCRKLSTFTPALAKELESYYELYKKVGFKKVIIIKPIHTPSAMQLKRVAQKANFDPHFASTDVEVEHIVESLRPAVKLNQ